MTSRSTFGRGWRALSPVSRVVWWALVATLIVLTALVLECKVTWYLSVDQFGYLTFAHDLRAGRIFHLWPPAVALADVLPARTDVLAQTYVYDHGRLYCRYAPGFPILLAGWLALFGDEGVHYLNPVLYLLTLTLVIAFQRRLFHSRWRALVGGFLLPLLPTMVHLWGLSLTRDISAHLVAFASLFLLLPWRGRRLDPSRLAAAGLLFGFAVSIRPDQVLYLAPAAVLASARWRNEGATPRAIGSALAAGLVFGLVGLTPLLAYDWLATGNPLEPTQGMEVETFLSDARAPAAATLVARADGGGDGIGYPSPVWHGGALAGVQGGGLRIAHLPHTLPGHLRFLEDAYGPVFLAAAVWGAGVALALRPLVFFLTVPYVLLSLLFYSCWAQPDTRYLIGTHLLLTVLVVEGLFGTFDLVRRLARRRTTARALAIAVAAALLAGAAFAPVSPDGSALPVLSCVVPLIVAAGAVVAAAWPHRRVAGLVAPAVALVVGGLAISRAVAALDHRASFQRPQVVRAVAALQRAIEPGAVIITTEDVGRAAENIEWYSGVAHALYLTDLARWQTPIKDVAARLLRAGTQPYLLLPADVPESAAVLGDVRGTLRVDLVRDIPAEQAIDYFVPGPAFAGIHMHLYRITPPDPAPPGASGCTIPDITSQMSS